MRNFGTSENYRGRVGNIRGRADNREHIYVGEREYEYERKVIKKFLIQKYF